MFSRQETSVSLFFQGNSLVLLVGINSSAFSFYLTFFVSLDVGETVIYLILKGNFMWEHPSVACVSVIILP